MQITNNNKLPESLVRAVESHGHKGGDYSASMMMEPARIVWLKKRHRNEMSEDVTERLWALFGTAIHQVIADHATDNEIAEGYLTTKVMGKTFSGSADVYEKNGTITDWKTDSVWTIIYGSRDKERESQLNAYAYLYRRAGFEVNKIQIISLLRDWSKSKAKFDKDYPQSQVVVKEYPLWSMEQADTYFCDRVKYYESFKDTPDDELPECSMSDKWQDETKHALMKEGRKSAIKLYTDKAEAESALSEKDNKHYIDIRESTPRRCEDYCSCNVFCNQYQKLKQG
jgi:hypothetical protein